MAGHFVGCVRQRRRATRGSSSTLKPSPPSFTGTVATSVTESIPGSPPPQQQQQLLLHPQRPPPQLASPLPATPATPGAAATAAATPRSATDVTAAADVEAGTGAETAAAVEGPHRQSGAKSRRSKTDSSSEDDGGGGGGSSGSSAPESQSNIGAETQEPARRTSARLRKRAADVAAAAVAAAAPSNVPSAMPPPPPPPPKSSNNAKRTPRAPAGAPSANVGGGAASEPKPPSKRRKRLPAGGGGDAAAATTAGVRGASSSSGGDDDDGAVAAASNDTDGNADKHVAAGDGDGDGEKDPQAAAVEPADMAAGREAGEADTETEEAGEMEEVDGEAKVKRRGKGKKKVEPAGAKPPRRTKAVVQQEVREAANQGRFASHVTLHGVYPHSRSYGPGAVALSLAALATAEEGNAHLAAAAAAAAGVRGNALAAAEDSAVAPAAAAQGMSIAVGGDGSGGNCDSNGSSGGGGGDGGSSSEGTERDGGGAAAGPRSGRTRREGGGGGRQGRGGRCRSRTRAKAAAGGAQEHGAEREDEAAAATAPPQPAVVHPVPAVVPNLGYACLCMTLREYDIFASRDTNRAGFQSRGLPHVSQLALANCRDLRPLIEWNEAHGIRLFRLSSGILPWMSFYRLEQLPDAAEIKQALADAGAAARRYGHRLTFHPSEFTKIASDKPEVVETSVKELEVHSLILDTMGFLPATPFNKINIHVGGVYGDKIASMDRFAKVVLERLSPNCRSRLTVENDDRPSMYSVRDLMYLANKAHIPIVFDFHHHRFCTGGRGRGGPRSALLASWVHRAVATLLCGGGLSEEEAFRLAISTWPPGVRPVVHWSESQEGRRPHAHSDYVSGPINLYGMENEVDVMIESKAKEVALLHYREAALGGRPAVRPELGGGRGPEGPEGGDDD
ncbi:hypothetical protein VOLCADRAFT_116697 [Volvox carteri f. nagariensis]|uniref:UV damage repair endonuclease n=1 Tax=Volvox carteri f. nagariensis TaxID=3068 RepID=D8TNZ3_VOLCA|nr:uncharacterized protein VOLCADRAFT_116697 [Volvox carteri f. nagariensis]EFJ50532.1 hypothetical protein VOLCADRAFT_116697 [Volvox carteri f. nagariensis]|eukprot:XP_002948125.1 hypothetical protein VOLCADRAFT_116697 [Volvox carteri f. nagariensis]